MQEPAAAQAAAPGRQQAGSSRQVLRQAGTMPGGQASAGRQIWREPFRRSLILDAREISVLDISTSADGRVPLGTGDVRSVQDGAQLCFL